MKQNLKEKKRKPTSHFSPHTSPKGITLIALVVTIIVMLILAGVTINLITRDESVLKQAKGSRDKQQEGKDLELIKVAVSAQNMELAITGGVIDSTYTSAIEAEIEKQLGEEVTVVANADSKSLTVTIGKDGDARVYPVALGDGNEVVISTATATTTTSPIETDDTTVSTTPNNQISIADLPAGTYVNYIDNSGNEIPCIILYDTTYNTTNGTNYGIQVISAAPVKQVTIGSDDVEQARLSYNSAISDLNYEAGTYLNTSYATAARCVGSLPSNPDSEGEEKDSTVYTAYTTTSFGTYKDEDENYVEDYTQMENLDIIFDEYEYWIASRP